MPKTQYSIVWDYFSALTDEKAKCNICNQALTRSGGSTSTLKKHLETQHAKQFNELKTKMAEAEAAKVEEMKMKTAREKAKEETKVQKSMTDCVAIKRKLTKDDPKCKLIDRKICEMIALDDLPFSTVEKLGFVRLLNEVAPNYELKSRPFYKNKFSEMYEDLKTKVAAYLSENISHGISLTTDIWSNKFESLFSLTAHFITAKFERKMIVLHAQPLTEERHTGANLAKTLENMLKGWNLSNSDIHIVLRDNGSNIVKAMGDMEITSTGCVAHNFNLIVKDGLEAQPIVRNALALCRNIATHFHHSDPARKRFKGVQLKLEPDSTPLKIVQEVKTRWNSTLDMITRLLALKEAIVIYGADVEEDWPLQWSLLPKIVNALQPFKDATVRLSGSKASIADVIPTIKWLTATLEKKETSDESSIGKLMDSLRSSISIRFANIEREQHYTIATFLDPRYKDKCFVQSATPKDVKMLIEKIAENDVVICSSNPKASNKKRKICESTVGNMDEFICAMSSDSEEDDSQNSAISEEISMYVKQKRIPPVEDPLRWWKQNSENFPSLAKIARKFLAAPPTSVPSEQLFSGAGIIYKPLRNRLLGDTAEKLLFMKYNLPEMFLLNTASC